MSRCSSHGVLLAELPCQLRCACWHCTAKLGLWGGNTQVLTHTVHFGSCRGWCVPIPSLPTPVVEKFVTTSPLHSLSLVQSQLQGLWLCCLSPEGQEACSDRSPVVLWPGPTPVACLLSHFHLKTCWFCISFCCCSLATRDFCSFHVSHFCLL